MSPFLSLPELQPTPPALTPEAVAAAREITIAERTITLKWHRGRLANDAAPFDPDVILAGLGGGARVEVDLKPLADGGFAVLHDATLARETTGRGRVAGLTTAELKALHMRAPDGRRLDRAPLELGDLLRLAARVVTGGARLHLDLKAGHEDLTPAHIEHFRKVAEPLQHRLELGARDWEAVTALGDGLPDLALGFDPTTVLLDQPGLDASGFEGLLASLREATRAASVYYLHHGTITTWQAMGVNPVGLFGTDGARVEAWTLNADDDGLEGLLGELAAAGIDGVITDDAPILAQIRV